MLAKKIGLTSINAWISIVLVTNAFVWYFFVLEILENISNTLEINGFASILVWIAHFASLAFSAVFGASLSRRFTDRMSFLLLWMILGTATSIVSVLIDLTYVPNVLLLSSIWGISLGLGMPCCMGYFTENTEIEKRGRLGGIILLISGVSMTVLGMMAGDNIAVRTSVLSGWRIFGLAFLVLFWRMREHNELSEYQKSRRDGASYKKLFSEKPFILFLVPWIMFSLITYLTTPIQVEIIGGPAVEFLYSIENILMAIFAVIGGFLADTVGRKLIAIQGFVLLGLGYSVLGILGNNPENLFSWYFYTVVDGIAWGLLFVVFVITVWGDLSQERSSDRHYAVGVLPFFISKFIQVTMGSDITYMIPRTAIFSFTALFLFLAVLPLVYAPETLPEKTMKDRELKNYIEKAQKEAAKAQNKESENKQCENKDEEELVEFKVNQEDDEKARQLAEKYY